MQEHIYEHQDQQYQQQYHRYQTPTDNTARQITDLEKLYNKEKKFGGRLYNILNSKLRIFYNNCTRIGLLKTMYSIALLTMFKEQASSYYYDQLSRKEYDFEFMIFKLKAHFDTDENRQEYMTE